MLSKFPSAIFIFYFISNLLNIEVLALGNETTISDESTQSTLIRSPGGPPAATVQMDSTLSATKATAVQMDSTLSATKATAVQMDSTLSTTKTKTATSTTPTTTKTKTATSTTPTTAKTNTATRTIAATTEINIATNTTIVTTQTTPHSKATQTGILSLTIIIPCLLAVSLP